jgi:hypothetical protein
MKASYALAYACFRHALAGSLHAANGLPAVVCCRKPKSDVDFLISEGADDVRKALGQFADARAIVSFDHHANERLRSRGAHQQSTIGSQFRLHAFDGGTEFRLVKYALGRPYVDKDLRVDVQVGG